MTGPETPPTVKPIPTREGPATTAEWREYHEDIGPFYKFLAFLAFLVLGALIFIQREGKHPITLTDVILYGLVISLIICLARPSRFDNWIKTLADKLPGKYQKPKDG